MWKRMLYRRWPFLIFGRRRAINVLNVAIVAIDRILDNEKANREDLLSEFGFIFEHLETELEIYHPQFVPALNRQWAKLKSTERIESPRAYAEIRTFQRMLEIQSLLLSGNTTSPDQTPTESDTDGLEVERREEELTLPGEELLLTSITNRFYHSGPVKFLFGAIFLAVSLAGASTIFVGQYSVNLLDNLDRAKDISLSDIQSSSKRIQKSLQDQEHTLTRSNEELVSLQNKFNNELTAARRQLDETLYDFNDDYEEIRFKAAEAAKTSAEKAIDEYRDTFLRNANADIETGKRQIQSIQKEINSLSEDTRTAREKTDRYWQLDQDITTLENKLKDLRSIDREIAKALDSSKTNSAKISTRVTETTGQKEQAADQLRLMEKSLEKFNGQLTTFYADIGSSSQSIEANKKQITDYTKKIKELQTLVNMTKELNTGEDGLEEILQQAKDNLKMIVTYEQTAKSSSAETGLILKNLKADQTTASNYVEMAKNSAAEVTQIKTNLGQEATTIYNEAIKLAKKIGIAKQQLVQLNTKLKDLELQLTKHKEDQQKVEPQLQSSSLSEIKMSTVNQLNSQNPPAAIIPSTQEQLTKLQWKQIQQRLLELGFDPEDIDGVYGTDTKAAIERFQRFNNESVTGILTEAQITQLLQKTN